MPPRNEIFKELSYVFIAAIAAARSRGSSAGC
jgi:hypothetical protein